MEQDIEMVSILKGYLDRDWHTKDEILRFLKFNHMELNERAYRELAVNFNRRYESGDQEFYIAHSCKGYYLTNDLETIMSSLNDDYGRAVSLMKRYWKCKKAIAEKNQLSLSPTESSVYDVVMSMQ